jgi:hypothetical protein
MCLRKTKSSNFKSKQMTDILATWLMFKLRCPVVSTSSYVIKVCLTYFCYMLLNLLQKHLFISIAFFSRHKAASRSSKLLCNPLVAVVHSIPFHPVSKHATLGCFPENICRQWRPLQVLQPCIYVYARFLANMYVWCVYTCMCTMPVHTWLYRRITLNVCCGSRCGTYI